MLLPPIEPIVDFIDKGLMRRLIDSASIEMGISGNTCRNILSGKTQPSAGTVHKFKGKLSGLLSFDVSNLFSLRSFARKNEWMAYLEGLRKGGLPSNIFPNLQSLIEKLALVDEEIERRHRSTEKIIQRLKALEPNFIVSDEISKIRTRMNRREIRSVLGVSRVKSTLLIISCFEVERILNSQSSNKESMYQALMVENPRRAWVELCKTYIGASSINDFSRMYADYLGLDYENSIRTIRRVSKGEHRIQPTTLENIIRLCEGENSRFELKVAYYVSEIARLLVQIIEYGEKEGLIDQSSSEILHESYSNCLSYWKKELGVAA